MAEKVYRIPRACSQAQARVITLATAHIPLATVENGPHSRSHQQNGPHCTCTTAMAQLREPSPHVMQAGNVLFVKWQALLEAGNLGLSRQDYRQSKQRRWSRPHTEYLGQRGAKPHRSRFSDRAQ